MIGFTRIKFWSRVAEVQILGKGENKGEDSTSYDAYDLNLVLENGSRINVLVQVGMLEAYLNAMLLARRLKCPIWTPDGELDPSPENIEECRKLIKKSSVLFRLKKVLANIVRKHPVPFLFIAVAVNGLLLYISWGGLIKPFYHWLNTRWVECPSTVTYSDTKRKKGSYTDSHGRKYRNVWIYDVDIHAEYKWNGKTYECRTYKFYCNNIRSHDRGQVEELLEKYPVGAKVSCFVNPDSPRESAFIREDWPVLLFFGMLVNGTMILLGFTVIFIAGRSLLFGSASPDDNSEDYE